ncbi:MAG: sulfite exporter TauE/SafE family protein [Chloroflexi bacterium]|nr:sulfite exporter TauE/SafE family protein [Chloroflexota bacterium]
MELIGFIGLFIAAVLAGGINSVAGGGTLVSFPALVAFGIPTINANATNTSALWPGSVSGAFAYARDTERDGALVWTLLIPSALGSLAGAFALVVTPEETFRRVVPFLVLFATLLFAFKDVYAKLTRRDVDIEHVSWLGRVWGFLFQFFIAAYGGYFGAGIGVLMLGSFSIMGLRDVHKMNAMKTILAAMINFLAFCFFAWRGLVVWQLAVWMAIGAILGGYLGARLAKRINQRDLRNFIVVVGVLVSGWLLLR